MLGTQPVNTKPYITPAQNDEIERDVKEMLLNGVIQPSASPFSSHVLIFKKKDGSWRFCIDYRRLNSITVKNKSSFHCRWVAGWAKRIMLVHKIGHEVWLPQSKGETRRHFQNYIQKSPWLVGIQNNALWFNKCLSHIPRTHEHNFGTNPQKVCLVFVDDILIYIMSLSKHMKHLQAMFNILKKKWVFLKKSKCSFAQ